MSDNQAGLDDWAADPEPEPDVEPTHEYRPPGDDIDAIYKRFGPWGCPVCGGISWKPYRCDNPVTEHGGICGADFVKGHEPEPVRFAPGESYE